MSIQEAEKMKERLPSGWTLEAMREEASAIESVIILYTGWYPEVMDPMLESAIKYLRSVGVPASSLHALPVPGSFELPLAALEAITLANPKPSLVVALGCVVRGGTPHFEYVCSAVSQGLMKVQLDTKVPVGFGVLTVDDLEQAMARKDKGFEAAQAAFFMHLFARRFEV